MTAYEHFNNLNPAHHELLIKLSEESSEIIKAVSKIMLHGIESTEPNQSLTNREKLQGELADFVFFYEQCAKYGLIDHNQVLEALRERAMRQVNYLHHVEIV